LDKRITQEEINQLVNGIPHQLACLTFKVILNPYLILKKMNERITDS